MKRKKVFKNIYFILIVMLISTTVFLIHIINKKSYSLIADYANFQMKKISIEVLRTTGLQEINEVIKNNDLYKVIKNDDGQVENIEFNTTILNNSLIIISSNVKKRLNEIQNGVNMPDDLYKMVFDKNLKKGIIYNVPLGITSNNAFLMNTGPYIPVKIEYNGEVGVDLKTRIEPYGINSALVSAYVYVEVVQKAILPFKTKEIKVSSEIPIIISVVKGITPNYMLKEGFGG